MLSTTQLKQINVLIPITISKYVIDNTLLTSFCNRTSIMQYFSMNICCKQIALPPEVLPGQLAAHTSLRPPQMETRGREMDRVGTPQSLQLLLVRAISGTCVALLIALQLTGLQLTALLLVRLMPRVWGG